MTSLRQALEDGASQVRCRRLHGEDLSGRESAIKVCAMNLEDHAGDVLRKARAMTNISSAAAAQAGGISELDLNTWEEIGKAPPQVNYAALGKLLSLDGARLERVAKGWLPSQKELGTWRELRCITNDSGGMAVNCYLVWDEVSREAALFDTGWDLAPILALVTENELQLRHLFVTHGHHDHIAALDALKEHFPKLKLHRSAKDAPVDQRNRPNDFIQLGSLRITNRDTPGHAADGTTYIVGTWPEDAPHVAFVGDALFAGSIGRGNQSWDLARQKVRQQIFSLPPETLLCPGHGPLTTVAEEVANNPFFP